MDVKHDGLSLQPFDQETFQRVWRRVMPQQDLSPIQPAVPALSQDRPQAPASPCPTPTDPPACLCERSESYIPCLHQLMEDTQGLTCAYQHAARRCGGRTARLLSSLLPSLDQDQRRLCAAVFLITGSRYTPKGSPVALSGAAPWQLRSLFLLEQQRAARLSDYAGNVSGDPCLRELLRELEHAARLRAGRIRALLEQM